MNYLLPHVLPYMDYLMPIALENANLNEKH